MGRGWFFSSCLLLGDMVTPLLSSRTIDIYQAEILIYLKMTLIPVNTTILMQRNPISIRVKIQGDSYRCCYLGGRED